MKKSVTAGTPNNRMDESSGGDYPGKGGHVRCRAGRDRNAYDVIRDIG